MLRAALEIYVQAFLPLTVLTLCAALRWGGLTERVVAWSFVFASLGQKWTQGLFAVAFSRIEPTVAIVDGVLLFVLLRQGMRDPQLWLLIACAFQLLSTLAHLARLIDFQMSPLAYAILTGTGAYPTQILLICGIAGHSLRSSRARAALP